MDVFDEDIGGGRFDRYAFILVCHGHVVDVDVGRPDVEAVQTAFVATANGYIIDL